MPDRIDKAMFLLGLVLFTAGQVVLNILGAASQDQHPIDYAHWLLLLGTVLLIPYTARLPREGFNLIISPVLLLSIVAMIGMNILDFTFWALPPELDGDVYRALSAEPTLWLPFMIAGPNEIFVTALVLPSLTLFKTSRVGTILVVAGAITMAIGTHWFNVAGYLLMIAGFFFNFEQLKEEAVDFEN